MSKRHPVSVYSYALLLVEDGDRYLLIQEADPARGQPWYFPAGGVEPGETLVEAAKREAREESGVEVELRGLLHFEQRKLWSDEQMDVISPEVFRFFFLASAVGGELKRHADEHSLGAGWFTVEEIRGLKLRHPEVLERIESYRREGRVLPMESVRAVS